MGRKLAPQPVRKREAQHWRYKSRTFDSCHSLQLFLHTLLSKDRYIISYACALTSFHNCFKCYGYLNKESCTRGNFSFPCCGTGVEEVFEVDTLPSQEYFIRNEYLLSFASKNFGGNHGIKLDVGE